MPGIWDQVIEDMKQRDQVGWSRYRKHLHPHDGRVTLQDAYEEALDMAVYLKKAIIEGEDKDKVIKGLSERVAAQAELLSRKAQKLVHIVDNKGNVTHLDFSKEEVPQVLE